MNHLLDWVWDQIVTRMFPLTPALSASAVATTVTPDMAAALMYGEEDGTDMATLDDDPSPEYIHWLCCPDCPHSAEALGYKKRGQI